MVVDVLARCKTASMIDFIGQNDLAPSRKVPKAWFLIVGEALQVGKFIRNVARLERFRGI